MPGGAGRYGGVTAPALPVRFVTGSVDVAIGRRIAVIAEAGAWSGPETVSCFAGALASRGAAFGVRGVRWCGREVRS